MKKNEIRKEIEKVQQQLRDLKEKLANTKSLSDAIVRENIDDASINYRQALGNAGLSDISEAFGQVVANGEYSGCGIFLTNCYGSRSWKWVVKYDLGTNSEVLVRVHKLTNEIID